MLFSPFYLFLLRSRMRKTLHGYLIFRNKQLCKHFRRCTNVFFSWRSKNVSCLINNIYEAFPTKRVKNNVLQLYILFSILDSIFLILLCFINNLTNLDIQLLILLLFKVPGIVDSEIKCFLTIKTLL